MKAFYCVLILVVVLFGGTNPARGTSRKSLVLCEPGNINNPAVASGPFHELVTAEVQIATNDNLSLFPTFTDSCDDALHVATEVDGLVASSWSQNRHYQFTRLSFEYKERHQAVSSIIAAEEITLLNAVGISIGIVTIFETAGYLIDSLSYHLLIGVLDKILATIIFDAGCNPADYVAIFLSLGSLTENFSIILIERPPRSFFVKFNFYICGVYRYILQI